MIKKVAIGETVADMSVADELDQMRSDNPTCSLVAFADLSSKLVLYTSTDGKPAQEELAALSEAARISLDGELADAAAPLWNGSKDALAETAVLMTESDLRVFLRSPGKATEALACICAPNADIQAVVDAGRSALSKISKHSG